MYPYKAFHCVQTLLCVTRGHCLLSWSRSTVMLRRLGNEVLCNKAPEAIRMNYVKNFMQFIEPDSDSSTRSSNESVSVHVCMYVCMYALNNTLAGRVAETNSNYLIYKYICTH